MREVNAMILEILLSQDRALEHGIDLQQCYQKLDDYMIKKGMKKISGGVYDGEDEKAFFVNWDLYRKLPKTDWFWKAIKAWYCREEGNEMSDRVDYIAEYVKFHPEVIEQYGIEKSNI